MTKFEVFNSFCDAEFLEADWDRLCRNERRVFPTFAEARYFLRHEEVRILVVRQDEAVSALACFALVTRRKRYKVGERVLFSLSARTADLVGSSVLGAPPIGAILEMFETISKIWNFDLINLGEVVIDSPLYRATDGLKSGMIRTRAERKTAIHWLINFPQSYDAFLRSLTAKTRRNIVYYERKLHKEHQTEFLVASDVSDIGWFLRDAERINRRTYKWKLGQNVRADEATTKRYEWLAKRGQLRCFMLYVDAEPCAFMGGYHTQGVYLWDTSGFDPSYEKASPGTVLLGWAIRDLIEKEKCSTLDFGSGGDNVGYKSKYGNVPIECSHLQVANVYKFHSLWLAGIQEALRILKNMASAVASYNPVRRRLKKYFRQYGDY